MENIDVRTAALAGFILADDALIAAEKRFDDIKLEVKAAISQLFQARTAYTRAESEFHRAVESGPAPGSVTDAARDAALLVWSERGDADEGEAMRTAIRAALPYLSMEA